MKIWRSGDFGDFEGFLKKRVITFLFLSEITGPYVGIFERSKFGDLGILGFRGQNDVKTGSNGSI